MQDDKAVNCPIDCPNRDLGSQQKRETGRKGAWIFTAILMLIFVGSSIEKDEDGWFRVKNDPPIVAWTFLMPPILLLLGVQVDKEDIGAAINKVINR